MSGLIFLSIFPAALLIAAATDIHDFRIPNWIPLTLIGGYFLAGAALGAPPAKIAEGVLLGCAILAVGFGLFAVRFFGGGDAKLLAATAPWIGLAPFFTFLASTAVAGGFLAIFLLAFRRTPVLPIYAHAPWIMRIHQNRHEIPYGVAIAAGGLMTLQDIAYFKLAFGG